MADERGIASRPVVFEGNEPVRIDEIAVEDVRSLLEPGKPRLPLGLPLALAGPVVAELRREPGGNLLVIADEDAAGSVLATAIAALKSANVEVDVLDFGPLDAPWLEPLDALQLQPARRRGGSAATGARRTRTRAPRTARPPGVSARLCPFCLAPRPGVRRSSTESASELLEEVLRDGRRRRPRHRLVRQTRLPIPPPFVEHSARVRAPIPGADEPG